MMNNNTTNICEQIASCPRDMYWSPGNVGGDAADDATWILTSSFVILTMQSGFGLLEMGCSMPGHEVHIMVKNVADVIFSSLAYWIAGYGISFGEKSNPFMGLSNFMPISSYDPLDSGLIFSKYIFQLSFAATSTTIVSGCIAMRTRFFPYVLYSFNAAILYAFVAHWVWADNGWLRVMGFNDFAGGAPVHLFGGVNGLLAIWMIGPRWGLFTGARKKTDFAPMSPSSQLFGLFMLWWGWIGFNCGSSFGVTGAKWVVAARAAISTVNSTAGGGLTAFVYSLAKTGGSRIGIDDLVNGILGSLVASSPTCACVNTYESIIIGCIGALVANITNEVVKKLKLDDPVGAVGVHAGGGMWGLIAVGLFADSKLPGIDIADGLFKGGGFSLLGVQLFGILAVMCWSLLTVPILFYLVGICISRDCRDPRTGLRVTIQEELVGADSFYHGISNADYTDTSKATVDTNSSDVPTTDRTEDQNDELNDDIENNLNVTKAGDSIRRMNGLRRQSTVLGFSRKSAR